MSKEKQADGSDRQMDPKATTPSQFAHFVGVDPAVACVTH